MYLLCFKRIKHTYEALTSASNYLGSDAGIFYTLWSSIWPDDALLQVDRFTSVLDTAENRRLKLKGYEYFSALDFSLVDWVSMDM